MLNIELNERVPEDNIFVVELQSPLGRIREYVGTDTEARAAIRSLVGAFPMAAGRAVIYQIVADYDVACAN